MQTEMSMRSQWEIIGGMIPGAWVLMALLFVPPDLSASWNLSFDGDARGTWTSPHEYAAEVHALGLSIRKSFADKSGDRFIISGLVEAENNFSDFMVHELYLRYKGPMGVWNITAGRIGIPYGLLTSFSTSRLLFETPVEEVIGFDADNGVMVSGIAGMFDYYISVSQGYGVHRMPMFPGEGYGAGRIGVTLGDAEEYVLGFSMAGGNTLTDHQIDTVRSRIAGGLDVTLNIGRAIVRGEVNVGRIDNNEIYTGFGLFDFALFHRCDLTTGIRIVHSADTTVSAGFAGFTFKPPWLTIRGGYTYEYSTVHVHSISLQVYRLFTFTF